MIINELIYTRYDACAAGQLPPHCTDGKTEVPVDWLKTQNPSCTSEPLGSSEGSLHTWTPGIKLRDRERPEIAFSIKQPISIFNDFFFVIWAVENSRSVQQTVPNLHFGGSSWLIKSIDITLPTEFYIVKATVFPVAMYGCEIWTINKAECQRIDSFKLWW